MTSSAEARFQAIACAMQNHSLSDLAIRTFFLYYRQLLEGETGLLPDTMLKPVNDLPDLDSLPDFTGAGAEALKSLVIIKLNGGLGTSMGLEKAKSLLPAKDGRSFLEIIARQILYLRRRFDSRIPLLLMNSFRTEKDSLRELNKYPELIETQDGIPLSFLQHKVPKIRKDDARMVSWPDNPELEWCPPGHGDLYPSLIDSGILAALLEKGFRYAFISNSDNLGATVDLSILGFLKKQSLPFIMECADRTAADKKGGHLARHVEGHLVLREIAQCPESDLSNFQDINKYRYFNTNSLWVDLHSLERALSKNDCILPLPLIRNLKNVMPGVQESPEVYQLETAMGSAISCIDEATAIRVPRSRFAPVKKTDDLLALWSDCFWLTEADEITPNPERRMGTIVVNLDPRYYMKIDEFMERFPYGAPSLVNCSSLTLRGDVRFEADVVLRGNVVIENSSTKPKWIKAGTIIEDYTE